MVTADGSSQPVLWTASRHLDAQALQDQPNLWPIRLPAGRFGNRGDLTLSPQHAVLVDGQPRDELEAMLAVPMGAIHTATMMMASRLNHVETIPQQESAERALNKLARTFAPQMEALKRYRTGGQQRVTVEHVTVNAGGQAIVGAVKHEG